MKPNSPIRSLICLTALLCAWLASAATVFGANQMSFTVVNDHLTNFLASPLAASYGFQIEHLGPNLADPALDFEGIVSPGTSATDHAGDSPRPFTSISSGTAQTFGIAVGADGSAAGAYSAGGTMSDTGSPEYKTRRHPTFPSLLTGLSNGERRFFLIMADYNKTSDDTLTTFEFALGDQNSTTFSPKVFVDPVTGGWRQDYVLWLLTVTRDTSDGDFHDNEAQLTMQFAIDQPFNFPNPETMFLDNILIMEIPEPSAVAMLGLAAGLLALRRHRHHAGRTIN